VIYASVGQKIALKSVEAWRKFDPLDVLQRSMRPSLMLQHLHLIFKTVVKVRDSRSSNWPGSTELNNVKLSLKETFISTF
jgi:hypothetical protein